jgi:hypothetical protein
MVRENLRAPLFRVDRRSLVGGLSPHVPTLATVSGDRLFVKREARMQEVTLEMTVRDVLPFLSPAQQINLRPWAEEFSIQLREFHMGHIRTYEGLRLRAASRETVNAEVSTLLDLLESVGAGKKIGMCYQPLREPAELSPEERASLPDRAVKYIEKLECELQEFEARNQRTENRLRKTTGRWSR